MAQSVVYSVAEVALMLGLSRSTVTRLFERERGVIVLERPEKMHKRRYRSIRIPIAVYERVIQRMTVR
jgi:AraC-like DNA-binding protein